MNSNTVFRAANNITSYGFLSGKGSLIKTGAGTLSGPVAVGPQVVHSVGQERVALIEPCSR